MSLGHSLLLPRLELCKEVRRRLAGTDLGSGEIQSTGRFIVPVTTSGKRVAARRRFYRGIGAWLCVRWRLLLSFNCFGGARERIESIISSEFCCARCSCLLCCGGLGRGDGDVRMEFDRFDVGGGYRYRFNCWTQYDLLPRVFIGVLLLGVGRGRCDKLFVGRSAFFTRALTLGTWFVRWRLGRRHYVCLVYGISGSHRGGTTCNSQFYSSRARRLRLSASLLVRGCTRGL